MEPLSPKDPKTIGDYMLIGRLGSGGMGVVYIAANGPDTVALKVVRESLLDDPAQSTRFAREIETLQKINSPFVARILESGVTDERAWYATEFVNGPDLKSLVEAKGPLSQEQWDQLAIGLASGLASIHAQGIIHRDIKPANIIMAESGPKIIDFGIAQVSDSTSITSTGLVAGSPAWFSPEQIEGKSLTTASDLFSAGSVLTYAAAGRSPWGDDSTMTKASVFGILVAEPNLSGASPEQLRIISALLKKEPSDREFPVQLSKAAGKQVNSSPGSTEAVELQPTKSSNLYSETQPSKSKKPVNKKSSRQGVAVWSASAAILVSLIVGLFLIPSGSSAPAPARSPGEPLELTIGGLVPRTGVLAFLGSPVEAAMLLAQKDINDSNSDITVDLVFADEGDFSSSIELDSAKFLAESRVSVVVGPMSNGRTLNVIDYLTIDNGIVMIAPSNSSKVFDNYDSNNLYFRTGASDSQQGTVLADLLIEDDVSSFAIVTVDEQYGKDLADDIVNRIKRLAPQLEIPRNFEIPIGGSLSQAQLVSLLDRSPEGIVLATFDEAQSVVPQLVEAGFQSSRIYLVDGNLANYSSTLPNGYLTGAKGTNPLVDPVFIEGNFYERLDSHWIAQGNPELDSYSYAAEAYDAVISAALASLVAASVTGEDISRALPLITEEFEAKEVCRTFDECVSLIQEGKEITYFGLTGPIGFNFGGLSTGARVSVYEYGRDNTYLPLELRTAFRESKNEVVAVY